MIEATLDGAGQQCRLWSAGTVRANERRGFQGGGGYMLLRGSVHNARSYTDNAQTEERLHLSGVFDWWPPGNRRQHAVSRCGVAGFSDTLAMEVAPFGVKISTLEPGGIRTNWARRAGQDAPELLPDYEGSVGPILGS
jgi:NAD(P)-dependent dehydrogenase (short-subunit alcohol dehydrogenase family)